MKVLYVEPFYSGSHKYWIDSYQKYSKHQIEILSLSGKNWKWRMHGGSVTLANKFIQLNKSYDLILVSDFLNLPVFKSICLKKIQNTKIVIYFHENQITYPWSPNDSDINLKRDLHYAFINYSSSLISDANLFNSYYHMNSYIKGLKKYLQIMPDLKNINTIDNIKNISSVLYLACDLDKLSFINKIYDDKPVILWNHRWEYDKNPDLFFKTLYKIKQLKIKFKLIVLGENFKEYPKIFDEAKKILKNNIIHMGYCKSYEEYIHWLSKADILPVTSIQDFFGVSIVEAIYMEIIPILPVRLSYPELINIKNNPEIFYNNNNELLLSLLAKLKDYKNLRKISTKYKDIIYRFNWSELINDYDDKFVQIYNN